MQFVGRFRELEPEHADAPLLVSLRGQLDDQNAKQVVEHLQRGVGVWDVMEAVLDPLDGTTVISGGSSLLTDGEWVWREDLAYFVQKYRIGLPDAFITHVTASAGHPGASIVDVSSCMDEVLRTAGWQA